uniref:RING-type domain-containing protein n=1 Tax=viral metagenome TaxID=1070528 RepID=A0A6C0CK78_9ZZZZ
MNETIRAHFENRLGPYLLDPYEVPHDFCRQYRRIFYDPGCNHILEMKQTKDVFARLGIDADYKSFMILLSMKWMPLKYENGQFEMFRVIDCGIYVYRSGWTRISTHPNHDSALLAFLGLVYAEGNFAAIRAIREFAAYTGPLVACYLISGMRNPDDESTGIVLKYEATPTVTETELMGYQLCMLTNMKEDTMVDIFDVPSGVYHYENKRAYVIDRTLYVEFYPNASHVDAELCDQLLATFGVVYDGISFVQKTAEVRESWHRMEHTEIIKKLKYALDEGREEIMVAGIPRRYQIELPMELNTRRLTEGQALTQEFISEREHLGPFMSHLAYRIGNSNRYICPRSSVMYQELEHTELISKKSGGLIADKTGTGKTLSTITRCLLNTVDRSLIVIPDDLCLHWKSEFEKHTTVEFTYLPDESKNKKRKITLSSTSIVFFKSVTDFRVVHIEELPRILVVSWNALKTQEFQDMFGRAHFTRLFIDEAHRMNQRYVYLDTISRDFTWIITATPYENTLVSMNLLQLTKIAGFLKVCRLGVILSRYWTCENALDMTNLKVKEIVHLTKLTEEQVEFYAKVSTILEEFIRRPSVNQTCLRFFRILERLGAGGYVHKELILRILKGLDRPVVVLHRPDAKEQAFAAATDDCPICLCVYTDPVQLSCRHVLCRICLDSMNELDMARCPQCRHSPITPYYNPSFASKRQPSSEQKYTQTVIGKVDANSGDYLHLSGKMDEFKRQLEEFKASRAPTDQLVVFSKYEPSAVEYARMIDACGFRLLVGGFLGIMKAESLQNIENFRQGKCDVLLLSNKYSVGFDLFMAKAVWMTNVDLSIATMEQSLGRITRVSQKNSEITVRVFLYENLFDHWVWLMKDKLDKVYTKPIYLMAFYYFLTRFQPNSKCNQLYKVLKYLVPEHAESLPTVGSTLNFENVMYCYRKHTIRYKSVPRLRVERFEQDTQVRFRGRVLDFKEFVEEWGDSLQILMSTLSNNNYV